LKLRFDALKPVEKLSASRKTKSEAELQNEEAPKQELGSQEGEG
jgi:hypothetical protein